MKYNIQLTVVDKDKSLYECFKPEVSKKDRSFYTLENKKGRLLFEVQAKDIIALKATINGIIKLLEVHNKVNQID